MWVTVEMSKVIDIFQGQYWREYGFSVKQIELGNQIDYCIVPI